MSGAPAGAGGGFSARGKALLWAGVVLACFVVVFVKVRVESSAALERARALRQSGDLDGAGLLYRRAIRWYTPLSSSVEAALTELRTLAEAREQAGDAARALELYRDLRGALYAVRHVLEPYRAQRDAAEEKIATLMAKEPPSLAADRGRTEDERRARYLAELRSVRAPDVAWTLALLAGFFAFVACAALFFWRGFTPDGALRPRPALGYGAGAVGAFALWVVGMTQA